MAMRQCGTCTLCCKLMGIGALDKPQGAWCVHCQPGQGCGIYPDRPQECRNFHCLWLTDESLGEEWYPKKSKMVLTHEGDRIIARVDPGAPDAWRRPPYFGGAEPDDAAGPGAGAAGLCRHQSAHHILLLPDRQEDLGPLGEADEVELATVSKPGGLEYRVTVRRRVGWSPCVSRSVAQLPGACASQLLPLIGCGLRRQILGVEGPS